MGIPWDSPLGRRIAAQYGLELPVGSEGKKARARKPKLELLQAKAIQAPEGLLLEVPLHLEPVVNGGSIKRQLIGRAGKHRLSVSRVFATCLPLLAPYAAALHAGERVRVAIVRVGGRRMDDDNLRIAAKWVRDTVALFLGVDDGDPRLRWEYDQSPGPVHGVRLVIHKENG